jgi:DASS family divalent anion:Na+ symporter
VLLFGATVCGLITRPLPSGAVVLVAITAGTLLRLFTIQDALSIRERHGVADRRGVPVRARLRRDAPRRAHRYTIVRRIGASPLRLGYSIVLADLVMSPMTPSNTARAGGILFPSR